VHHIRPPRSPKGYVAAVKSDGFAALGFIVASAIFGFTLGSVFAFVMVAFAGTAILYNTSQVLHQYNTKQHVAASLTLFAGIALLFWYILTIFSSRE